MRARWIWRGGMEDGGRGDDDEGVRRTGVVHKRHKSSQMGWGMARGPPVEGPCAQFVRTRARVYWI